MISYLLLFVVRSINSDFSWALILIPASMASLRLDFFHTCNCCDSQFWYTALQSISLHFFSMTAMLMLVFNKSFFFVFLGDTQQPNMRWEGFLSLKSRPSYGFFPDVGQKICTTKCGEIISHFVLHLLNGQYKQLRWCNMYDTSILGHSSGVVAVVAALKKIVCLTQNR